MLRRAPTRITLTSEDIASYEDSRQAEREEEEEEEAQAIASAARHRKAKERPHYGNGVVRGDGYRDLQTMAAQRRLDDSREAHRERDVGRGGEREGNAENELSGDEDRQVERERAERDRTRERDRSRVLERETRVQRNREERLGLGAGNGGASGR